MLALFAAMTVIMVPFLVTAALLILCGRLQQRRARRAARQVEVTDAIHRELGAVVAPSLTRGTRGGYRLILPAPLEHASVVASALAIVHRVVGGWDAEEIRHMEIVVVPRVS
jgi:hypothetical protein